MEAAVVPAGVEAANGSDAADPFLTGRPEGVLANPVRGNNPEAGDDNSPHGVISSLGLIGANKGENGRNLKEPLHLLLRQLWGWWTDPTSYAIYLY